MWIWHISGGWCTTRGKEKRIESFVVVYVVPLRTCPKIITCCRYAYFAPPPGSSAKSLCLSLRMTLYDRLQTPSIPLHEKIDSVRRKAVEMMT